MKQNTSKKQKYHHLLKDERDVISLGLAQGKSDAMIGLELGRNKSTIFRERKRNLPEVRDVRYLPHRAQTRSEDRKKKSHAKLRLKNKKTREHVIAKLKEGHSPEQIAGRMRHEKMNVQTNHESIYLFIYLEKPELIKYLRKHHRTRRNRGSGKNKRAAKVLNRVMIDKRSKKADRREEYGHYEADTIVSRKSLAAMQVIIERKSRYVMISQLIAKTAPCMSIAMNRRLRRIPERMRKTMTYDNGTENANHEYNNLKLGMRSYFCYPYHSWEKGGVENMNGLIREYLPKGCDLSKFTRQEVQAIERRLNNRPRKCLGYRTPAEVFGRCCT